MVGPVAKVVGTEQRAGMGWLKVIGLIPVPLLIALIIIQAILGSSAVFEPPYLLPTLNILLIIPFAVAFLCWRGYVSTGAIRILLIGCGMITLGLASLAAGFAIAFPGGLNLSAIIYNTGALIAALFIVPASLLAIRHRKPYTSPGHGRVYASVAYMSTLIVIALFIAAAFRGWIPPFFLPDSGFTLLRMAVLGTAMALFALSSILFLISFARWSGFAYWFGLGLALITIGLIAALLAKAIGTPLGWTSRAARYTGCVYMLIGILTSVRLSHLKRVPIADEIVNSFARSPVNYNTLTRKQLAKLLERHLDLFENSGTGIVIIDEDGRFLMANKRVAASFKKTIAEIIGMSLYDFLPRETADRYIELNRQLLLTGGRREYADTFVLPTGERSFLMVDTCLKDESGKYFAIQHSSIDITEKRKVEVALAASEAKYRSLVETSSAGVASIDIQGNLTFVNTKMCEMTGYSTEELIGRPFEDFLAPDELDKVRDLFAAGLAQPERYMALEFKLINKNGSTLWFYTSPRQLILNGKLAGFATVIFDITDRKQAEEALRESELRYRDLFNSTNNGVAVYEAAADGEDFIIKDFNSAAEMIENVKKEDIIDKSILQAFPGVKEFGLFDVLQRVWRTGVPERHPITQYRDERISGWRDNYVYRLSSDEIVAIYNDVTESKQAEEALKKSEERFKNMASLLPQVIFEADEKSNFTFVNRQGLEIFGYSEAEAAGMNVLETIIPQDWSRAMENIGARIKGQNSPSNEYTAVRKDGSKFPVTIYASPIMLNSRYAGMRGILVDITERKNIETELKASHEEMRALAGNLQMAMEAERKRIARMIHDDLGQTLTALQIELSGLTKKLPADHKQLSAKAAAMNKLITLMDERVKHITTELRPPLLDELGLCAAVKLSLNEFSKRTGTRHEVHCDPEDFTLDTDIAIALFRVLQESLTNITRHSEADMVTVHLQKLQDCVSLQIKDNGKGIGKRELSNKKSIGIIGMRERVAFFGGKMRITSPPGGGTIIDVKIPLGQDATP